MIDQETIDRVREATDVVDLLGQYIRLKKKGKYFWGLCPFHQEKTPSFKVGQDNQLYHCFGCGKGGNVYTFLMEHEQMSFVEAVRFLAARANIPIRESGSDYRREDTERLNYAHEIALQYFQSQLHLDRFTSVYETYLQKKRGLTVETIDQFKLGLATSEWDGLILYAKSKDLSPADLEKAGLALKSEKTGNHFDRFRERLMIPIHNLSRRPIAFGGRTLKKGEPAKYINSPETPLYHKSSVLYGLTEAREHIRNANSVIVVEGYFDVIQLWQSGIKNVVASSGTAFTSQQARLLARFADSAFLFFDADSAGQQAALRSIDALYDAGLDVLVMTASPGEDPDSIARDQGADGIEAIKSQAQPYIAYRLADINARQAGLIAREKLTKELAALAGKIGDPTRRALFLQEASERLDVSPAVLERAGASAKPESTPDPAPSPTTHRLELEFLSLLTHNPGKLDQVFETISPDDLDSKQLSRLYSAMITQYTMDDEINTARLIETFQDDDLRSVLTAAASIEWDKEQVPGAIRDIMNRFKDRKTRRLRTKLREELARAEEAGDRDRADEILDELKRHGW